MNSHALFELLIYIFIMIVIEFGAILLILGINILSIVIDRYDPTRFCKISF